MVMLLVSSLKRIITLHSVLAAILDLTSLRSNQTSLHISKIEFMIGTNYLPSFMGFFSKVHNSDLGSNPLYYMNHS